MTTSCNSTNCFTDSVESLGSCAHAVTLTNARSENIILFILLMTVIWIIFDRIICDDLPICIEGNGEYCSPLRYRGLTHNFIIVHSS